MKIAITGHTRGLGAGLVALLRTEGHQISGFSRTNGYDLAEPKTIAKIVTSCADADVFINNAWHQWGQIDLLYAIFAEWKHSPRQIVNIGSNSPDSAKNFEHKYAITKGALDEACSQLNQVDGAKCRVVNIRPGWVRTERTQALDIQDPMLSVESVAAAVSWVLKQPTTIHIPSLTLLAKT